MFRIALLTAITLAGACDDDAGTADISCGVAPPGDSKLLFVKTGGTCDNIDEHISDIRYSDIDDEELGCALVSVEDSAEACDVVFKCMGLLFDGQEYNMEMSFDFRGFPIYGDATLTVFNPSNGEICDATYDASFQ